MFNELSLEKVNTKQAAKDILEQFVKSSIRAAEFGFNEIRLYEKTLQNLYQIPLYSNYNIDNWLNDIDVNSDLRERFREITTSFPLITEAEIKENELYQRSEFHKNINVRKLQVWGLGAAYIYNTLSISMDTYSEWKKNSVHLLHYYLDDKGNELVRDVEVRHFSNADSFDVHIEWWAQMQKTSLQKSTELWEKRKEYFPYLEFCNEVEKQLKKIGVSKMLYQIYDRLSTLNTYVKVWEEGSFSYEDVNSSTNLRISPESDNTIRLFGAQRKFSVPGQDKKIFDRIPPVKCPFSCND